MKCWAKVRKAIVGQAVVCCSVASISRVFIATPASKDCAKEDEIRYFKPFIQSTVQRRGAKTVESLLTRAKELFVAHKIEMRTEVVVAGKRTRSVEFS